MGITLVPQMVARGESWAGYMAPEQAAEVIICLALTNNIPLLLHRNRVRIHLFQNAGGSSLKMDRFK